MCAEGSCCDRALERFENYLAVHAFVPGDTTKYRVQRPNAQTLMRGHNNTLMGWFFGLEHDVAAFLVNNLIAPTSTQPPGEVRPAQVARDLHPFARTSSRTR